jgi:branched-chain amino acid transport system permease protein
MNVLSQITEPMNLQPKNFPAWKGAAALAATVVLVFLALVPQLLSGYWIRVITGALMFVVITSSLNLIVGYAGYAAFGNVVFFGLGAYAAGIAATHFQASMPVSIIIAALVGTGFSLLFGYPLMRIKGGYFAIATLALNEAMKQVVYNLEITGGGRGMSMPISPHSSQAVYSNIYYQMFALLLVCVGSIWVISRIPFGLAIRALRDQEDAAEVMGIDTTVYRMLAWAISAFFMALTGGIWAFWISFFEPHTAFDIMISVKAFVMMLLGGMGTIFGPVFGAFLLEIVSEVIWGTFAEVHRLVFGLIVVFAVLLMPEGLMSLGGKRWQLPPSLRLFLRPPQSEGMKR